MTPRSPLILCAAGLLALTACVDPNAYPNDPNARTRNGAVIGGLVGAVAGSAIGGGNDFGNAVLGGAIGAGVGALIGQDLDSQSADLRNSIDNPYVSVTNTGSFLVVNMPQDLLFATDSAFLRPDLSRDIRAVARNLLRYPYSVIEVIGHTDDVGAASYNADLSERRAISVADVLRDSGVPSRRISAYGRGEDQPVASNATDRGRAQNRRVEIIIRPTN